jgi:hypothetical protein
MYATLARCSDCLGMTSALLVQLTVRRVHVRDGTCCVRMVGVRAGQHCIVVHVLFAGTGARDLTKPA